MPDICTKPIPKAIVLDMALGRLCGGAIAEKQTQALGDGQMQTLMRRVSPVSNWKVEHAPGFDREFVDLLSQDTSGVLIAQLKKQLCALAGHDVSDHIAIFETVSTRACEGSPFWSGTTVHAEKAGFHIPRSAVQIEETSEGLELRFDRAGYKVRRAAKEYCDFDHADIEAARE